MHGSKCMVEKLGKKRDFSGFFVFSLKITFFFNFSIVHLDPCTYRCCVYTPTQLRLTSVHPCHNYCWSLLVLARWSFKQVTHCHFRPILEAFWVHFERMFQLTCSVRQVSQGYPWGLWWLCAVEYPRSLSHPSWFAARPLYKRTNTKTKKGPF